MKLENELHERVSFSIYRYSLILEPGMILYRKQWPVYGVIRFEIIVKR